MPDTSQKQLPRMHFVSNYIQSPLHPVTVTLIGAGGNGSQMLSALGRINIALKSLGHPGLHVTVWDPDTVEKPNIGRQLFTWSELGMNKATALVSRFNRFYGTGWDAVPEKFNLTGLPRNIIITCVDNVKARLEVSKLFNDKSNNNKYTGEEYKNYYWLDLGNAQNTGQAILGSQKIQQPKTKKFEVVDTLPSLDKEVNLKKIKESDSGPSCSMAEALEKQDLFINSTLVQLAGSLLWSLFRDIAIDIRGFYINLETMKTNPIKI